MCDDKNVKLIREYERLRKLAHELDVQANWVDRRLTEIERQLPDRYTHPSDPPLEDVDDPCK